MDRARRGFIAMCRGTLAVCETWRTVGIFSHTDDFDGSASCDTRDIRNTLTDCSARSIGTCYMVVFFLIPIVLANQLRPRADPVALILAREQVHRFPFSSPTVYTST